MAKVGTTVGRVNVKVFPDTKDFRKSLERQLDSIERGLLVTIQTELDTKKLDEKARAAVESLNSKGRRNFQDYTVTFNTDLDTRGLSSEATRAAREAERAAAEGKFSVRFDPDDFNEIERAISQVDERIKEKRRIDIEVDISDEELGALRETLDEQRLKTDLGIRYDPSDVEDARRVLGELDRIAQRERQVELDVNLQNIDEVRQELSDLVNDYDERDINFEAQVESLAARAELARTARDRIVNLYVRVNQASVAAAATALAALSGGRLVSSTLDNLREMFQNLDKNIPLIGSIAMAVAGLSSWLLAAASNAFALARSLAQMFGAGLALPGILTGMVAGISATIAVFKDFNSEMPHIGRAFRDLQNVMSIQFWARVRGPMQELTDTILPQLSRGLVGTSGALAVFFGNVADSLSRTFNRSLPGMFRNLNDSIAISAGYTDAFAESLEVLGRHGSNYLPQLARWWGNLNEQLSVWLRMNSATGRLQGFIDLGIFQIQEFGRAVRGLWGVLTGLGKAAEAAGGSTLSILADTLEGMSRVINGASFQENLTNALLGAHEAMSAIAHRSGPATKAMFEALGETLSGTFVTAGNAIGDLFDGIFGALAQPEFQSGLTAFFEGIRVGVERLTPAFGPMGIALGRIGELAGNLAKDFGPVLNVLFTQLADLAVRLAPSLERLVTSLSGLFVELLEGLAPAVVDIADSFAKFIANVPAPALIIGVAAGFVALKTAIAGLWVAQNFAAINAGLAALIGHMKVFKAQHAGFVSSLGRVGKVAGIVGAALAGLAIVNVAASAFDRAQISSVQQFASAIDNLGGSLEDTADGLQNISPTGALSGLFKLESTAGWIPGLTVRIESMADALSRTTSNGFERGVLGLVDAIGGAENPIKLADEAIASFDAGLAQVVNSGNLEDAKTAADNFTRAALAQGLTIQDANRMLPQYRDAVLAVAQAEEAAAEEAARTAERVERYNSAIQEAGGISASAVQGINDASKSFIDFSAGLDDAELSLQGWIDMLEKQVESQIKWADNMAELSQRGMSDALRQELEELGPAAARFVQDLVDMGDGADAELARLEEIVRMKGEGAAGAAESSFGQIAGKIRAAVATLPAEVQAEFEKTYPEFYDGGAGMADSVSKGLAEKGDSIRQALDFELQDALPGAGMIDEMFSPTGKTIADAIAGAVSTNSAQVRENVDQVVRGAEPSNDLIESIFGPSGSYIGSSIAGGMTRQSSTVRRAGSALIGAARQGASANSGGWDVIGRMAVAGLAKGINNNLWLARAAGSSAGYAAKAGAEKALLVKSPSREFERIGLYSVQGLAIGLSQTGIVSQAAADLAASVLAASERQMDLYSQGAQLGRSYADGIASQEDRSRAAAEVLRNGLNAGLGDDLTSNLRSVSARIDGDGTAAQPLPVYFPAGTEMTLMVDGQPMRALIQQGARAEIDSEQRDFTGRRGGY